MSVLYVAEFNSIGGASNFPVQGPQVPPVAEQIVSIGGSSTACTNSFNVNTTFVRVATDSICSIAFGQGTPTATTSNMRLAANQTEYFAIPPGGGYRIAVITNS